MARRNTSPGLLAGIVVRNGPCNGPLRAYKRFLLLTRPLFTDPSVGCVVRIPRETVCPRAPAKPRTGPEQYLAKGLKGRMSPCRKLRPTFSGSKPNISQDAWQGASDTATEPREARISLSAASYKRSTVL